MRRVVLLACFGLGAAPAWAHGELGGGEGILSGLTHFATSPLAIAGLLGLSAAVYVVDEKRVAGIAVPAGLVAGASSFLVGLAPSYLAPSLIALVGLIAVFGVKLTDVAAILLALVAGFAAGVAADLDPPTVARAAGVAIAQAALLSSALHALPELDKVRALQGVLPIARRVLGSWIAAMGLLMAALGFHLTKS